MGAQRQADAWILGYEWAMGDIYIGKDHQDLNITSLQIMPEFEEGVQAAINTLKRQELVKLVLGDSNDNEDS